MNDKTRNFIIAIVLLVFFLWISNRMGYIIGYYNGMSDGVQIYQGSILEENDKSKDS